MEFIKFSMQKKDRKDYFIKNIDCYKLILLREAFI